MNIEFSNSDDKIWGGKGGKKKLWKRKKHKGQNDGMGRKTG